MSRLVTFGLVLVMLGILGALQGIHDYHEGKFALGVGTTVAGTFLAVIAFAASLETP